MPSLQGKSVHVLVVVLRAKRTSHRMRERVEPTYTEPLLNTLPESEQVLREIVDQLKEEGDGT